jgi:hypothetical protein
MPSFNECIDLSREASPIWKLYLRKHFDSHVIDIIDQEQNQKFQAKKWGDILLIQDYEDKMNRYLTVELKTRSWQYYSYYKQDRNFLLEIQGNRELQRNGSSILECKADLLGYGFYNREYQTLVEPCLFHVEPLVEWLAIHYQDYKNMSSDTSGLYHTDNRLIPEVDIFNYMLLPKVTIPRFIRMEKPQPEKTSNFNCYHCNFKTDSEQEYVTHGLSFHRYKPMFPNEAELERYHLIPQGKRWEKPFMSKEKAEDNLATWAEKRMKQEHETSKPIKETKTFSYTEGYTFTRTTLDDYGE